MADFLFDDILPDTSKDEVLSSIAKISRTALAVVKSLPKDSGVLAYSGGIDSAIMASLILDRRNDIDLLTLGRAGSSDLLASRESRVEFAKTEILFKTVEKSEIERAALRVAEIVSVTNLAHFEDCIAFWLIAERAKENGNTSYVVSANGPDELFCGYNRFRRLLDSEGYEAVEHEIIFALSQAENLGSQVRVVLSHFGLGIFEPFLKEEFKKAALDIAIQQKILKGNDLLRKRAWRCFGRSLGLRDEIVLRPKKAMQYGMGVHQVVKDMIKHGELGLEFSTKQSKIISSN